MPAQQRQLKKNYIGILCDKTDERHAAEQPARSDRSIKDYLLGLVAVVLNRDAGAR